MSDDLTAGELGRRIEDVRQDLKEDVHGVVGLVDKKADAALTEERHTTLVGRVSKLEEQAAERERRAQNDRRLLLFSLLVPVLLLAIQLYNSRGR